MSEKNDFSAFAGKRRHRLVDQLAGGRQEQGGREASGRHGVQKVGFVTARPPARERASETGRERAARPSRGRCYELNFERFLSIFGDFCQFFGGKLAFYSKINVMITFFAKTGANIFAQIFGENIFKIVTSVPASDLCSSSQKSSSQTLTHLPTKINFLSFM
jgi:hypothetical protein